MLATDNKIITRLNFHAFWTKKMFQFLSDRNFIKTWLNYGYCFKNTLTKQQFLLCHILKVCPVKVINMWWALTKRLPHQTFNFCRKALILRLPNKYNLYHWKITEDNLCYFCHHMQTQLHVFSHCEKCLNRYTWSLC